MNPLCFIITCRQIQGIPTYKAICSQNPHNETTKSTVADGNDPFGGIVQSVEGRAKHCDTHVEIKVINLVATYICGRVDLEEQHSEVYSVLMLHVVCLNVRSFPLCRVDSEGGE